MDVGIGLIRQEHWADGDAGPGTPTALLLPLQGHLGTSLGAVDANGRVVEAIGHDAFGQRTDGSAAAQSHRFAGEYWDEDGQLVYLRARWYDPKLGRFISGDPFEGRQGDPRSLNRYGYAHGDPVHLAAPSGAFSMGEIGAGLNVQGVLANTARHYAFDYLQSRIFGEDDTLDGPESLYEMLIGTLMKSLVGSVTAPAGPLGGGGLGFGGSGGGSGVEGHHVIPEYMCGAARQVDLVDISVPDHRRLHSQMINFDRAVTFGAKVYDVVFRKRQALELKSPINKLARTKKGRAVIAAALEAFYYDNDWFFAGRGQKTRAPIGFVLGFEATEFVKNNHQYHLVLPCRKRLRTCRLSNIVHGRSPRCGGKLDSWRASRPTSMLLRLLCLPSPRPSLTGPRRRTMR